jgi:hypothetical protein
MILSNRQKQAISDLIEKFSVANMHNAFNHDGHKIYYDPQNSVVIFVTKVSRALTNMIDEEYAMTVIDQKGNFTPLSHSIKVLQDRLNYVQSLPLIKEHNK